MLTRRVAARHIVSLCAPVLCWNPLNREVARHERALAGRRILMFVDDVYEDLELWYPRLRLIEAGADRDGRRPGGRSGLSR